MNLHRTEKVPQWGLKKPSERNNWQKMAAWSHGIIKPGNVATTAGGILVFWGLNDIRKGRNLAGTVKIGAGRTLDLVDGWVSEMTETKSPGGEAYDAGLDGVEMLAALPILVPKGMLPKRTAAVFGVQKLISTAATYEAKKLGHEIHPTWPGKISNGASWFTIGMYGLSEVSRRAGHEGRANLLTGVALVSEAVAVPVGTIACAGYIWDAFATPTRGSAIEESLALEELPAILPLD